MQQQEGEEPVHTWTVTLTPSLSFALCLFVFTDCKYEDVTMTTSQPQTGGVVQHVSTDLTAATSC